ncbi:hypothetical protein [Kistimonas scapharcae]
MIGKIVYTSNVLAIKETTTKRLIEAVVNMTSAGSVCSTLRLLIEVNKQQIPTTTTITADLHGGMMEVGGIEEGGLI